VAEKPSNSPPNARQRPPSAVAGGSSLQRAVAEGRWGASRWACSGGVRDVPTISVLYRSSSITPPAPATRRTERTPEDFRCPLTRPELAGARPIEISVQALEEVRPPSPRSTTSRLRCVPPMVERSKAFRPGPTLLDDPVQCVTGIAASTPADYLRPDALRSAVPMACRRSAPTPVDENRFFGRERNLVHSYRPGSERPVERTCISFKDCLRFLQAFQRGEIDRIVVGVRVSTGADVCRARNVRSASNTLCEDGPLLRRKGGFVRHTTCDHNSRIRFSVPICPRPDFDCGLHVTARFGRAEFLFPGFGGFPIAGS